MKSGSVEVNYETQAEDYRRVLFLYHRKRLLLVGGLYLLVLMPIVFFLTYGAGGSTIEGQGPTVVFIMLLVLPVGLAASLYLGVWRQARKTARITEPAVATFADAGLRVKTRSSTSEMDWSRFSKILVTKADIIFFPYENVFYSIPKRFFRSNTDLVAVESILRTKLGDRLRIKR